MTFPRPTLTFKQQQFVIEYCRDFNGYQAALRAGYSRHTARQQASRLLTKANIVKTIKQYQAMALVKTTDELAHLINRLRKKAQEASEANDYFLAIRTLELMGKYVGVCG